MRVFDDFQLSIVDQAIYLGEELTSNYYKISFMHWRKSFYDFKTQAHLDLSEIDETAFAQIVRYVGKPIDSHLRSSIYDFYKICLQDSVILKALDREKEISLFPLMLYIVTHELIHIVRFNKFLHRFDSVEDAREREEALVHFLTYDVLKNVNFHGISIVLDLFKDRRSFIGHSIDKWKEGGRENLNYS
jgi:hypothetical protein